MSKYSRIFVSDDMNKPPRELEGVDLSAQIARKVRPYPRNKFEKKIMCRVLL